MVPRLAAPDEVPDVVRNNFSDEAIERWATEELNTREPGNLPLPDESEDIAEWVLNYLQGEVDGENHRAHQYTVNHVTYPFVRDQHFAAFPLVPPMSDGKEDRGDISPTAYRRQLELFAGASAVQPGDLMFFYKSDSQQEATSDYDDYGNDLERNRGIVGVYRAMTEAFVDWTSVTHDLPDSSAPGYRIAGSCDECGCVFSWMRGDSKEGPENDFDDEDGGWCPGSALYDGHGHHPNENTKKGSLALSGRIQLEPVVQYSLPATDNAVYGTLEGDAVVWTGRFDNAMGSGKGSTIRHLLPEEATQLTRILDTQAQNLAEMVDGQTRQVASEAVDYPGSDTVLPLMYYSGLPISYSEVVRKNPVDSLTDLPRVGGATAEKLREAGLDSIGDVETAETSELKRVDGIGGTIVDKAMRYAERARASPQYGTRLENHLLLEMTRRANSESSFVEVLGDILNEDPEVLLTQLEYFCWEFPWGFANDQADFVCTYREEERQRVVLIENKKGSIGGSYPLVELMLYVPWTAKVMSRYAHPPVDQIEITPILVGQQAGDDWDQILTDGYEFSYSPPQVMREGSTRTVTVEVAESEFVTYNADGVDTTVHGNQFSNGLEFTRQLGYERAEWEPALSSLSATGKETGYIASRWPDDL
ncbi:hypothetical protein PM035_12885 [Halorubrum ezzemoulense]|uniref:helix-hairpin-helix domain-containing protein n=1 Tax=Halorubrum ezzemoulense TaxID=337243 RepID=UPI00232ADCD7|nr:helix-hairpin-helix domain-containing protein [Halorubrum ezzemoulense]MDB2261821.1 hypothetical protein [Halorubrum ezzemoulense]MDB2268583.1 hypothetical protein [Halorubrum ezzemoulense]